MALSIVQSSDGRRQRSERSQTAIIKAALSLMDEGTLVPTAQQIADRAGVGIRSFFRHFADMDSLFLAADEMLLSSYEALFEVDDRGEGSGNALNHIGIEVQTTEDVGEQDVALSEAGLAVRRDDGVVCCHAEQDKIYVVDPDGF